MTAKLFSFSLQLAAQRANGRWSEADALRFVVHFAGDINQPLHAISDADLGGNCEQLDPPIGDAKNIHSLWDGEMVRALNGSAVSLAANIETYLKALGPEKQAE